MEEIDLMNREPWYNATTLEELGELTAQWVTGELDNHPGVHGGPEAETADIAPVLAQLNRHGLVTYQSQPGGAGDGWRQRAAVSGFATAETWELIEAAITKFNDNRRGKYYNQPNHDPGLHAFAHPVASRRWFSYRAPGWCVSEARNRNGEWRDSCSFGDQMRPRDIHRYVYPYGHTDAIAAAEGALQVTVIDMEYGESSRLWDLLRKTLDPMSDPDERRRRQLAALTPEQRSTVFARAAHYATAQTRKSLEADPEHIKQWPDGWLARLARGEVSEHPCAGCGELHETRGDLKDCDDCRRCSGVDSGI